MTKPGGSLPALDKEDSSKKWDTMECKHKANDPIAHYAALGMVFGTAIGAALDETGTGVALGLAIGAGIGTWLKKKQDTASRPAEGDSEIDV